MAENIGLTKYNGIRLCDFLLLHIRQNFRSQKEAAQFFGISQPHLSGILRGNKTPTESMMDHAGFIVTRELRRKDG